jgi:phosphate uptake regulator
MDIGTLSLILAIPIGIAANLLTPKFQKWVEQRSEKGRKQTQIKVQAEYERISNYKSNLSDFYIFLLVVSLKITFIYALSSIFSTVINMLPNALDVFANVTNNSGLDRGSYSNSIFQVTRVMDSLIRLMLTLLVFNYCKDALNVASKVVNFDKYTDSIKIDTSSNKQINKV